MAITSNDAGVSRTATNSFKTKSSLNSGGKDYMFYDLNKLPQSYNIARLPYSLKILLENLLRTENGVTVTKKDIESLLNWKSNSAPSEEIAFTPSRVILQDFTGVPAVVDLAAMREAMAALKGNPDKINPLSPVELVIDHSVMVDYFGSPDAFQKNVQMEFGRNEERYAFLRWGQTAFKNFKVVPPGTGIVHQVNLEYLARVVFSDEKSNEGKSKECVAYPDSLVGTDSHTTMINGLGVLGWGVGGIEAEAAMLGQPITMLIPEVVGFKFTGKLPEGTTATDLVLTVVEMLRRKKVVGKFVEFYGDGLDALTIADRATIANMAPEYGATCGIFPIDAETLNYLRLSGRPNALVQLVEDYAKAQGMFRETGAKDAEYSDQLSLDLNTVLPCIAGPRRPQDRILLKESKEKFNTLLQEQKIASKEVLVQMDGQANNQSNIQAKEQMKDQSYSLTHGAVVIAAITSCTNTSNPDVMIAAGLIAKKAEQLGLKPKPWVKTSLAPGSQVVSDYLEKAGLMSCLNAIGFDLVGYGCTTCIGNSGPLPAPVSEAIKSGNLSVAAVLSGNRNFEGRIHPEVRFAYLASPPLVVIYALAGTMNIDLYQDVIGYSKDGKPVKFIDLWPKSADIQRVQHESLKGEMFSKRYSSVFAGDALWQNLTTPKGELFKWDDASTYVKNPPFFTDMKLTPGGVSNIENARVLALLGDSVTTDHISPAGDIQKNSPAGLYLESLGVKPSGFNSYGSRRGNHEVMMRGTFANIRLKNFLVPDTEGNWTLYLPTGEKMSIYDAAMLYQKDQCPLIIIAGKEYGTGSSRDWAAKGTRLLGVRAVIAESFERIHRSNLIGMGVLPLEFKPGENVQSLKLTGHETYQINLEGFAQNQEIIVNVRPQAKTGKIMDAETESAPARQFSANVRIDTPKELEYFQHGGILHYVLRSLAKA